MRTAIFTSIFILFMFLALTTPARASEDTPINTITMDNVGELYGDLGPLKLFMLMLTPKDQRPMYYHSVSIDASENCKSPNKWYFEGLVEDDICREMEKNGYNVVCNTACPQERRTGITCGLSHECCLPPVVEEETQEAEPVRCAPSGEGRGIQYCTFF